MEEEWNEEKREEEEGHYVRKKQQRGKNRKSRINIKRKRAKREKG